MQPAILSSLLPCLPRHHAVSEAMFVDCTNWFIPVVENMFSMAELEPVHPLQAVPFITPYLHMMRRSSFFLPDTTQTRFQMLFKGSKFSSGHADAM